MDSILKNELNNALNACGLQKPAGTGASADRPLEETCRMELGHYLLYIADGVPFPTGEQAMLINSVWAGVHPSVTHRDMKRVMDDLSFPDASENETLTVFLQHRKADQLIRLYDLFGRFMVSISRNAVSEGRYDRYMKAMRERVRTESSL